MFEVLMVVNINIMAFWNLMLRGLVNRYQNFEKFATSVFMVKVWERLFCPEGKSSGFYQNVCTFLLEYMESYPRTPY
jgi:hypothetical protein